MGDHNLDIAPKVKFDGDDGGGAQAKLLYQRKKTTEEKDGTIKSAKPCRKFDEIKEEERTRRQDVWIEKRNQHGFHNKPITVRWPLRWEVTDKKVTWSDEFLVTIRAYFGAMKILLQLTSRQPLPRRSPTARGQAMIRGMGVYRHEGLAPESGKNKDDVRDRGNDGASLRLDVCESCDS